MYSIIFSSILLLLESNLCSFQFDWCNSLFRFYDDFGFKVYADCFWISLMMPRWGEIDFNK